MKKYYAISGIILSSLLSIGCQEENIITGSGTGVGGTAATSSNLFFGSGIGSSFNASELEILESTVQPSGSTLVSAYIVDANNLLSAATHTVTFGSKCVTQGLATFGGTNTITTSTGIASITYTDQGCSVSDTIVASVTLNGAAQIASSDITLSNTGPVITTGTLLFGSGTGPDFNLGSLEIKDNSIAANGSTVISAYVVDANNQLDTGSHTVSFTSNCLTQSLANFSATSVPTTTGIASTTYNDQGCTVSDTINATVTLNSVDVYASGSITIESPVIDNTVTSKIGFGAPGVTFVNGVLNLEATSLIAGQSIFVNVDVVDGVNNDLVTTPLTIDFDSTCVQSLQATFSTSSVQTNTGQATTNYTASGCSGNDTITASVDIDGTILTASSNITVAQAAAGSIQFTSATPSLIALKSTGSTTGTPENSNIIFTVLDAQGSPISGEDVSFSLDSSIGGVALVSSTATSNSNGEVIATVNSGTVATSVRVTAQVVGNPLLITTSNAISIATGPPDQDSMSIAATILNPRAWNRDGAVSIITARLADRFNNPIQDGTAVTFTTELGSIEPSCETVNGACSVTWTSSNPRSNSNVANNAGRSTILAFVEGEESFTDVNSNGFFDDGDSLVGFDLGEAFLDEDEDRAYNTFDGSEFFFDFDNDGSYDFPNGLYNGSGCMGALCDTASESISVRDDLVIVMAENIPQIYRVFTNVAPGPIAIADVAEGSLDPILNPEHNYCDNLNVRTDDDCFNDGSSTAITFPSQLDVASASFPERQISWVSFAIMGAQNAQVLPIGTQIKSSVSNGKITGGANWTVGNNNANGIYYYTVSLAKDTTPSADGALTVEVDIGEGGDSFIETVILIDDNPATPAADVVPNVVGLLQADAEADIVAAGFTVGAVTTATDPVVPAGDIISQTPVAGTSYFSGTTLPDVDLVVSTGP